MKGLERRHKGKDPGGAARVSQTCKKSQDYRKSQIWNHFGVITMVVMNEIIREDKKRHRSRMKTWGIRICKERHGTQTRDEKVCGKCQRKAPTVCCSRTTAGESFKKASVN